MRLDIYSKMTAPQSERWRWRLIADNGEVLVHSDEGFTTRQGVYNNIRLVRDGLADFSPATYNVDEEEPRDGEEESSS